MDFRKKNGPAIAPNDSRPDRQQLSSKMPVITILPHGVSCGCAPSNNSHERSKREAAHGWSDKATRNNTRWLQSVDHDHLDGDGYACTLTIRKSPATPENWATIRDQLFKRLIRMGAVRLHWVCEWQERRVPHLHLAVWFNGKEGAPQALENPCSTIVRHWIEITRLLGVSPRAQHVIPIAEFGGWSKYVSKHASRGAQHYQRNINSRPPNWQTSGRVWGYRGKWHTIEPIKLEVTPATFYQFRRIMQKLRLQDARRGNSLDRIEHAKGLLHHRCSKLGRILGMSDWMDRSMTVDVIGHLMLQSDSKRRSTPDRCTCTECTAERYAKYFRTGVRDKRQWSSNPVPHH